VIRLLVAAPTPVYVGAACSGPLEVGGLRYPDRNAFSSAWAIAWVNLQLRQRGAPAKFHRFI